MNEHEPQELLTILFENLQIRLQEFETEHLPMGHMVEPTQVKEEFSVPPKGSTPLKFFRAYAASVERFIIKLKALGTPIIIRDLNLFEDMPKGKFGYYYWAEVQVGDAPPNVMFTDHVKDFLQDQQ